MHNCCSPLQFYYVFSLGPISFIKIRINKIYGKKRSMLIAKRAGNDNY